MDKNVLIAKAEDQSFAGLVNDLASFDENPPMEPAWAEFYYYFRAGDALGQIALSDVYTPGSHETECKVFWKLVSEAVEDEHQLATFYADLREAIRTNTVMAVDQETAQREVQAFVAGANHAIREFKLQN